jgi:hypothetical protein
LARRADSANVGTSVLRVFAGLLASAAVSGAFVCAVAVVKPGAGPAPSWPTAKRVQATPMPVRAIEPGPATSAATFAPVLTPATATIVRVAPRARPGVRATTTPKPAAATPEAAAPSTPTPGPTPAAATAAPAPQAPPVTPEAKPAPGLLQGARTATGDTVSTATRTAATAVAPVSPPLAGTVRQAGDAVAAIVSGG